MLDTVELETDDWYRRYPDQYASHPSAKEHARSLVNEVHSVAAQLKQAEDAEHRLHRHPTTEQPHSTKDVDRKRRRLLGDSRSLLERIVDWTGLGGVHRRGEGFKEDEEPRGPLRLLPRRRG